MLVFRIATGEWANSLTGSGYAARWNSNGIPMLYTSWCRSLACLENIVHRRYIGAGDKFRIVSIEIPDNIKGEEILLKDLPEGWNNADDSGYKFCRSIGDEWVASRRSLFLKVPSSIINEEWNILINPYHSSSSSLKIIGTFKFLFDKRIGF